MYTIPLKVSRDVTLLTTALPSYSEYLQRLVIVRYPVQLVLGRVERDGVGAAGAAGVHRVIAGRGHDLGNIERFL